MADKAILKFTNQVKSSKVKFMKSFNLLKKKELT